MCHPILPFVQVRQSCVNTVNLFIMRPSEARCIKIVRSLPCPCPCPLARCLHLPNREQCYRQRGRVIGPALKLKCLILCPRPFIDLSQICPVTSGSLVLTSGRFASAKPTQGRKDVRVKCCCGVMRQVVGEMGRVYVSR